MKLAQPLHLQGARLSTSSMKMMAGLMAAAASNTAWICRTGPLCGNRIQHVEG